MAKKEGKKNRKYGRNKVFCTRYKNEMREVRNKRRVAARIKREYERKVEKMLIRFGKGKPVPKHWRPSLASLLS